jgi:biopolymer transport protein ExbD
MRRRKRCEEEAFQMAPMIDMVFLLLVFFMTVSTLAKAARPETELPVSGTARVPSEAPPREVLTLVPEAGGYRIFWHNRPVDAVELPRLLKPCAAAAGDGELLLRGPPELPWKALQPVVEQVRHAGIGEVVFATWEQ